MAKSPFTLISSQSKPKKQSVPKDPVECKHHGVPGFFIQGFIQVYRKRNSRSWIKKGVYKPTAVMLCGDCWKEGRTTIVAEDGRD